MNPTTPENYDIAGHNESARWKNTMQNLGMPWTSEEIAIAHHWWSEERPADTNRRLILDSFMTPNGYSPLLGFAGGSELIRAHTDLAQRRTQECVVQMIDDAQAKDKKYRELKALLVNKRCQLPGILDMLGMENRIPFERMLEIVLREVFEYIDSLEDEDHRNLCSDYVSLFFQIHLDGHTAHFIQISNTLKRGGIVLSQ